MGGNFDFSIFQQAHAAHQLVALVMSAMYAQALRLRAGQ
jgi:hypothetical protein